METQDQRIAKVKAQVAAEKELGIENKLKAGKKSGLSAKAQDLYGKALNEKQGLTLVPAGKAPKQDEDGNDLSNHLVEVELIDSEGIRSRASQMGWPCMVGSVRSVDAGAGISPVADQHLFGFAETRHESLPLG